SCRTRHSPSGTVVAVSFSAPRISGRLRDEIERLAEKPYRAAEICRAIGEQAEEQGFRRPSYEQVRFLVGEARRRRRRVSTAKVCSTLGFGFITPTRSSSTSPARTRASIPSNRLLLRRGRPDEEAGGGLLGDRLLAAVQTHRELLGRRLRLAHLDRRAGHEALVVEPVQQVAVVLGEADDLGARPGLQVGERRELAVLGLLEVGVDGPA